MDNFKSSGKITKILKIAGIACAAIWLANVVALCIPGIATMGWLSVWPILSATNSIAWIKLIIQLACFITITNFFEGAYELVKLSPEIFNSLSNELNILNMHIYEAKIRGLV